jgi:hypothetical protein
VGDSQRTRRMWPGYRPYAGYRLTSSWAYVAFACRLPARSRCLCGAMMGGNTMPLSETRNHQG